MLIVRWEYLCGHYNVLQFPGYEFGGKQVTERVDRLTRFCGPCLEDMAKAAG